MTAQTAPCENCGRTDQPTKLVSLYGGYNVGDVTVSWCGSCRNYELGEDNEYEPTNQGQALARR